MSEVATAQLKQALGAPVEDFTLVPINGKRTRLQSLLEGKRGALIVFWSGVCSHCARYDRYLNNFAFEHPELNLVAVASRHGETVEQIRETIAERGLTFPILHDPGGQLASRWFAQQTPRVFLIDANRVLLYRGAIDNYRFPEEAEYGAYLEPAINEFLAGLPVTRAETASFGCDIRSVYYVMPKVL